MYFYEQNNDNILDYKIETKQYWNEIDINHLEMGILF